MDLEGLMWALVHHLIGLLELIETSYTCGACLFLPEISRLYRNSSKLKPFFLFS
jgi:hypothetical protein